MARRCGWCHHRDRAQLERRVLSGESVTLVAADSGHSVRAAYRHLQNHVRPDLAAALAERGVSAVAADFGSRHLGLADSLVAIREYAHQTGDARLALQAIQAEAGILGVLISKLGIDSEATLADLQDGRALAHATVRALASHPDALEDVAADLADHGHDELADAITASVGRFRRLAVAQSIRHNEETRS